MTTTTTPYGNGYTYYFPYPKEIVDRTCVSGLDMPIRDLFEMMGRDVESCNPQRAALYRLIAAYYPHCDGSGGAVERDRHGNLILGDDDWDSMSVEEKLTRGNINATIAVLDRLRFDLEMMSDDPSNNEEVDEIRRALGSIVEDRC